MVKIKKIPKNFVICDGMTQEIDFFWNWLLLIGLFSGIGGCFVLLHYWDKIKKKLKRETNEKDRIADFFINPITVIFFLVLFLVLLLATNI